MKILIVGSTQEELSPLLHQPELLKKCDFLITGVGIPAATFHLTKQLHHHHYSWVIQAGVAGYFPNNQQQASEPGDIVLVEKDAFGDLAALVNNEVKSLTDLNLTNENEWLPNPYLNRIETNFRKVSAITVNTLTDDVQRINALSQKWKAGIESMEGAALHYVCTQQKQPFLQIRAISNMVGERDKSKWRLGLAIENLNQAVLTLLGSFHKQKQPIRSL